MSSIKSCPNCGNDPLVFENFQEVQGNLGVSRQNVYHLECTSCGLFAAQALKVEQAVFFWNRHVTSILYAREEQYGVQLLMADKKNGYTAGLSSYWEKARNIVEQRQEWLHLNRSGKDDNTGQNKIIM